ncbi:MAG: NAD-dependent epimerase/dehydratase family protein [Cyclobacteriaceae bacterium]|nr:NAD-dependent epimerase/dehydratase family protein [Cyclobacteriaceae bacterium]
MILVTGASGLLGQHLVETLCQRGVAVSVLVRKAAQTSFPAGVIIHEGDVLDVYSLGAALQGVDTVIHSAGLVSFNPRRRDEIYAVNVEGTRNIVNACLNYGVNTMVHISSVAALGRKPNAVTTEADPWTGQYADDYARSKYLAELEVFRGGEEGMTVSLVNPAVILSGQPLHRSSGSLMDYVWNERPFFTKGRMNYVDVRDVSDAVMKLLENPQPGERFTLCGGGISYPEFFMAVAKRWKKRAPYIGLPGFTVRAFGAAEELRGLITGREPMVTRHSATMTTRNFRYDTSKVTSALGLRFRTLDETLDWCCARYEQDVRGNK